MSMGMMNEREYRIYINNVLQHTVIQLGSLVVAATQE